MTRQNVSCVYGPVVEIICHSLGQLNNYPVMPSWRLLSDQVSRIPPHIAGSLAHGNAQHRVSVTLTNASVRREWLLFERHDIQCPSDLLIVFDNA